MTLRDLIDLSLGNLWRAKLRTFLTVAGVVIAIATLVGMLSFAAGNHKHVSQGFDEFGLLTKMNVYPRSGSREVGAPEAAVLDAAAIEALSAIPGVKFAFPFVDFNVTVAVADTVVATMARVLTVNAMANPVFSAQLDGATFSSDDAREAIVTRSFLDLVGMRDAESLVGQTLVISMKVASLDSALIHVVGNPRREMIELLGTVRRDSLNDPTYVRGLLRRELSTRARRFFEGLMERQATVADTLLIRAVGGVPGPRRVRLAPVIIAEGTARRLSSAGDGLSTDPADLFAALQSGDLFPAERESRIGSYPQATLDLDPRVSAVSVRDSVEALGFRAFSFAQEFAEIQRFFVYYYLGMSVLGFLALITAALGIVNTMVMSITERRREIGILKSLGAAERDIRHVFLVESASIGFIGATVGIFLGWLGTRIASGVLKIIMERQDVPAFEAFAMPLWLVWLAVAFGVVVSLLAGHYPARLAARVDPVEALRSE